MKILILISRILVGSLFIVSGLIKANDPLGFSYKLEEYFEVFAEDVEPVQDSITITVINGSDELAKSTFELVQEMPVGTWSISFGKADTMLVQAGSKRVGLRDSAAVNGGDTVLLVACNVEAYNHTIFSEKLEKSTTGSIALSATIVDRTGNTLASIPVTSSNVDGTFDVTALIKPDGILVDFFHWMFGYALLLAIVICILEIVLGVAAIIGVQGRLVAWFLLVLIVKFTFLTFYSAYFDKVKECGCFGDALSLTPWESFWKDAVLLFFILIIFIGRKRITINTFQENLYILPISLALIAWFSFGIVSWGFPVLFALICYLLAWVITHYLKNSLSGWVVDAAMIIVTTIFTLYCLNNLPIRDFRPYAVGKSIPEQMKVPEGAEPSVYENTFIYEKIATGEQKEFTTENYPWDDPAWKWVETITKLVKQGFEPKISDFKIMNLEDGGEVTDEFMNEPGYLLFFIHYDLGKSDTTQLQKANALADAAFADGKYAIGLTANLADEIDAFKAAHGTTYDFYNCDGIVLKTMIRSNPGIMLMKAGTVVGKWHINNIPDYEEVKTLYKE